MKKLLMMAFVIFALIISGCLTKPDLIKDNVQGEPPIMLNCEQNSDCPNPQYNQYQCDEIFKYGKVCIAKREGGLSGKTPGCTNDRSRDLLNGGCKPEDGEFCINGQPYMSFCPSTDWCVDQQYCVRKR